MMPHNFLNSILIVVFLELCEIFCVFSGARREDLEGERMFSVV